MTVISMSVISIKMPYLTLKKCPLFLQQCGLLAIFMAAFSMVFESL